MSEEASYLVADIGGTNARFGIATGSAAAGFRLEQVRRLKNEDFETLRDAAHAYLESCTMARPARGCFAVAGPVSPGRVQLTNSPWHFCPQELAKDIGLERLLPVNDFAAQARGAPLTEPSGKAALSPGKAVPSAPCAVLGPGTGLGLGLLISCPDGIQVVPTEGGHVGFGPRSEEEVAIWRFLLGEYEYVSWERLLSGRGLVNIHRALCHITGEPWPGLRPEDITSQAMADETSTSRKVVEIFCGCLGAYAGDVTVVTGARGGVFLTGGILPRIRALLEDGAFHRQFTQRGPMSHYVDDIPVTLITSDTAPLLGAAALAERGGL